MPILVESSPTVASLCREEKRELTAKRMCNFLSLPRNLAPFKGKKVRTRGAVSALYLRLILFHLHPACRQQHLSFALTHSYFPLAHTKCDRWLGLRKSHVSMWRAGTVVWEVEGPRDTRGSVSTDVAVTEINSSWSKRNDFLW